MRYRGTVTTGSDGARGGSESEAPRSRKRLRGFRGSEAPQKQCSRMSVDPSRPRLQREWERMNMWATGEPVDAECRKHVA
jgi:hypothetical protein